MKILNEFKTLMKGLVSNRIKENNHKKISIVHFIGFMFAGCFSSVFIISMFSGGVLFYFAALILTIISSIGLSCWTKKNFKEKIVNSFDEEFNSLERFGKFFSYLFYTNDSTETYHEFFNINPLSLRKAMMSKEDLQLMTDLLVEEFGMSNFETEMKSISTKKRIREDSGISYYCMFRVLYSLGLNSKLKKDNENVNLLISKLQPSKEIINNTELEYEVKS